MLASAPSLPGPAPGGAPGGDDLADFVSIGSTAVVNAGLARTLRAERAELDGRSAASGASLERERAGRARTRRDLAAARAELSDLARDAAVLSESSSIAHETRRTLVRNLADGVAAIVCPGPAGTAAWGGAGGGGVSAGGGDGGEEAGTAPPARADEAGTGGGLDLSEFVAACRTSGLEVGAALAASRETVAGHRSKAEEARAEAAMIRERVRASQYAGNREDLRRAVELKEAEAAEAERRRAAVAASIQRTREEFTKAGRLSAEKVSLPSVPPPVVFILSLSLPPPFLTVPSFPFPFTPFHPQGRNLMAAKEKNRAAEAELEVALEARLKEGRALEAEGAALRTELTALSGALDQVRRQHAVVEGLREKTEEASGARTELAEALPRLREGRDRAEAGRAAASVQEEEARKAVSAVAREEEAVSGAEAVMDGLEAQSAATVLVEMEKLRKEEGRLVVLTAAQQVEASRGEDEGGTGADLEAKIKAVEESIEEGELEKEAARTALAEVEAEATKSRERAAKEIQGIRQMIAATEATIGEEKATVAKIREEREAEMEKMRAARRGEMKKQADQQQLESEVYRFAIRILKKKTAEIERLQGDPISTHPDSPTKALKFPPYQGSGEDLVLSTETKASPAISKRRSSRRRGRAY